LNAPAPVYRQMALPLGIDFGEVLWILKHYDRRWGNENISLPPL